MGFGLMGAIPAIAGVVGGFINQGKKNRLIDQAMKNYETYKTSPYAEDEYGLAKTVLNSRMAGAERAESNIRQGVSNAVSQAANAATDSSQLLAASTAAQAQGGDQFSQLAGQEEQDHMNKTQLFDHASEVMTNEKEKEYESRLQKFMTGLNLRMGALNSGGQNFANSMGLLGQVFTGARYGLFGNGLEDILAK